MQVERPVGARPDRRLQFVGMAAEAFLVGREYGAEASRPRLQRHHGPAEAAKIAAYYSRTTKAEVALLLETRTAVGNVRRLEDGRFAIYK